MHGQSAVRSYLKNCVYCQFHGAESSTQFMAALPKERLVSGMCAFLITGYNLIGPIFVTGTELKKIKRWGDYLHASLQEPFIWKCVMTCHAIHF